MEENKKTKNIKLTLYIIGILCLMVGVSYATYNLVLKGNKEHQVNIGSLTLKYEETNNINVTGDTLKTDEEGIASTNSFNFKVSVNNTTSKDVNYIVYLTMDEEYKANAKVGKVYLNNKTKNITYGPSFITDLSKYKYTNSYVLCTDTFTSTTETHEYELKSWISATAARNETDDTHETFLGGAVKFKVSVETTNLDASGANEPVLASNMIPVYYDETSDVWKKADASNTNKTNPWYSYNSTGEYKGMWANAVTVKDTNRQTYLNATPGTVIPMDDITTMWVWIPRFKVNTINFDAISGKCSCDGNSSYSKEQCINTDYVAWICPNPGAIDVTFVKENETAIDSFTFGTKQLSGFWYGKFETSHTTLASSTTKNNLGCTNETCSNANGIIIKPNVTSLRYNSVSNFFFASRSMEQPNNSFGFVSSEVDTHMSKNNEWGAVAYLTQSIHGRCTNSTTCSEIYKNNSSGYYTGRSDDLPFNNYDYDSYTKNGTYEYNQNKIKTTIVGGTTITPTITNDTTYPWTNNNGVYSSGNSAQGDTTSTLTYTFTLTDKGVVSFDYSVSSENNYDKMKYTINKDSTTVVEGTEISGTLSETTESSLQYENKVHVLEKGTYTLVFTYSKDGSGNSGLDKGYVKNVKVLNGVQTIDKVLPGGQQASTTGTIYGIYDMNGGATEYVMGVLADTNGKPRTGYDSSSNSGFTGMLKDGTTYTGIAFPDSKYYNLYKGSSYTGHALTETAGWYYDHEEFVISSSPWFNRGGLYGAMWANPGIFHFYYNDGGIGFETSSRFSMINE